MRSALPEKTRRGDFTVGEELQATVAVDAARCVGCGVCVADCFPGALAIEGGVAVCTGPCLECGHCVAVCPQGAVSLTGYDMGEVEEVGPGVPLLDPAALRHALRARRSIRSYEPRPLGDDVVAAMADAARYTPTARNLQGTSLAVVRAGMGEFRALVWEELPGIVAALREGAPAHAAAFERLLARRAADGTDGLLFDAPAFVAVVSPNMWDAGMAAAHVELAAQARGAGVLHSGYLKRIVTASARLRSWLGLAVGDEVACCMLAGYPAVRYLRTPPRKPVRVVER